ncbi:class I fructose-bisphosphate aldolase [Maridesulfovibrio hydrothermalis]|uniref:Fructose-bisphosphate aldolase n=1 Tax=Maridesulfovibrio hydrothermalis AM13 = DSM 14728 TaxID=1121451 RepID=L0RD80_9BACT|nr:2-amino-3,7-dideoxy-D-threo-hept-6-ulosonate synthase [Maridesulfovibrio hydrothermalis]CCO23501.1 Fructose-bisphosphate aldolase [Maridesulfovibrio hydrothermalis AM13 = DSM 14728]
MNGTNRRMKRLFDKDSGNALILALDHGANDGMIEGLGNIQSILEALPASGVQGVILNKGLAKHYGSLVPPEINLIIQLNAGTRHGSPSYNKNLVCSIPEALRLGADAVSMHVNIGNEFEDRMLVDLGDVTNEAHQLGIPVLATVIARGSHIVNEHDSTLVAHCIRIGAELGPDIVAVPFPNNGDAFGKAVAASPVPVLVTGGPLGQTLEGALSNTLGGLESGCKGCCIGRNIFQTENPIESMEKFAEIAHKKAIISDD